ncbi:MAG: spoVR like family protein [Micavibrio sp.]|nr:spoVR like family protein [Micavibrio sp.]
MDNLPEEQKDYYKKIQDLLGHYKDGWEVFINAHKAKDFDYPLIRKPEFENDPYLPSTWIELVAVTQGIIAKDMLGLDFYPPQIEIIRADHMLDVYTTVGLPGGYKHWSFGKKRMIEEKKYDASKHLAYEIVINSEPCIAYCMDTNSPVMQMLVIAHACYGHNAVFKNNTLFKEFTNAEAILADVANLKNFVLQCEQKYGQEEVSDFLDFCHAMQFMDIPDTAGHRIRTKSELKARAEEKKRLDLDAGSRITFNGEAASKTRNDNQPTFPHRGVRNVLGYMADHDEYFPDWKRTIMKMRSELSQYFKPQMMTQKLNEGFATWTHTKIMNTMFKMGLMDWGMNQEFNNSNDGVLYQPSAIRLVKDEEGKIHEQFVGASLNPYAIGFAMYDDIERICDNPTEEDKLWFKHFAGNKDGVEMVKHAMETTSDETFIEQYLSPTVMRKFAFFEIEDVAKKNFFEVTSIHNAAGFRNIRQQLANDCRTFDIIPNIRVHDYQETDRCLILRHQMKDGAPLEPKSLQQILELMHSQRGYPVVVESVDETGNVRETFSSPEKYDYAKYKRTYRHLSP